MRAVKYPDQKMVILRNVSSAMNDRFGRLLFPGDTDEESRIEKMRNFQFQTLKEKDSELYDSLMMGLKQLSHSACDINLDYNSKAIPGLDFETLRDLNEFAELASKVSNLIYYTK